MENFDLYSKNWDTENRTERAKAIANEICNHIEINSNEKSAMEFGCGTGLVGFQLADRFKSIIFTDSSNGMIEQVEKKISELNITASTLCCDFLTDIPSDLHVDYIFSSLVLHHIIDTKMILARLYKVLNNGGHLLIVDIDKDDGSFHAKYPDFDGHNGFDQLSLMNLIKEVGFSKANIHTFYHNSKCFNGKKSPYSLFILDAEK